MITQWVHVMRYAKTLLVKDHGGADAVTNGPSGDNVPFQITQVTTLPG